MSKRSKIQVMSNLDNATPAQMERVYKNVAKALNTMYKSVIKRKLEEVSKLGGVEYKLLKKD